MFYGNCGASQGVLVVKNWPANAGDTGDLGLLPGLGRSPGGGQGNPLHYSCLENPHGQRRLAGYSPWGHNESDMTVTKHSTGVPKILLQAVNASWLGPISMFLNYCFPMVLWSTLCDTFSFTFGYIWKDHQRIGPFKNMNSAPAYIQLESQRSFHCSFLKQGWCTFVNTAFWNSPLSFYKRSLSLISLICLMSHS